MKLICYPLSDDPPPLRAAPSKRDWMDATPEAYAYRCLPLAIANSHGWEVVNPIAFEAEWSGKIDKDSIAIEVDDSAPIPTTSHVKPMSHFGSGIITFELPFMLRTPPGWNVMVSGPINRPKDGIAALSGVIETDWSPYTFTMNWMFTRPGCRVRFEAGEPIAHIMPMRRGQLEKFDPEVRIIHEDVDRLEQNNLWRESRTGFLDGLEGKEDWAVDEKWQKLYYRGVRPDGKPGTKDHIIKARIKDFTPEGRAAEMFEGEGMEMRRKPGS